MKKYLANLITSLRIVGTVVLIFLDADFKLTSPFMIVYLLCGFTDILDGFVARITKTTSDFGSKLDTVSDILFYLVSVLKFRVFETFKEYNLLTYLMVVIVIRLLCYLYVALKHNDLESRHTIFNKITGFLVFLFPLMKNFNSIFRYYLIIGLSVAYAALADEVRLLFIEHREGNYFEKA